jgi:hypothetical protein
MNTFKPPQVMFSDEKRHRLALDPLAVPIDNVFMVYIFHHVLRRHSRPDHESPTTRPTCYGSRRALNVLPETLLAPVGGPCILVVEGAVVFILPTHERDSCGRQNKLGLVGGWWGAGGGLVGGWWGWSLLACSGWGVLVSGERL